MSLAQSSSRGRRRSIGLGAAPAVGPAYTPLRPTGRKVGGVLSATAGDFLNDEPRCKGVFRRNCAASGLRGKPVRRSPPGAVAVVT